MAVMHFKKKEQKSSFSLYRKVEKYHEGIMEEKGAKIVIFLCRKVEKYHGIMQIGFRNSNSFSHPPLISSQI